MTKRGDDIMWRHDKRKTDYTIMGFAVDQDGVPVVVYTPYGGMGVMHTRPCNEFFDGRFTQVPGAQSAKPNFGPGSQFVQSGHQYSHARLDGEGKGNPELETASERAARRDTSAVIPELEPASDGGIVRQTDG